MGLLLGAQQQTVVLQAHPGGADAADHQVSAWAREKNAASVAAPDRRIMTRRQYTLH